MFITEVYQSKGVKESTLLSNVGQGAIAVARKSYLKDNQPIDEKITQLSGVINF